MAAAVHLREANADTHQEWKSTLVVAPTEPLEPPRTRGTFKLAEEIRNRLPVPGTQVKAALRYGMSLWGETCKIEALLPSGERRNYLLKVLPDDIGEMMTKGEFESLKAMHAVSPGFVPEPHSQGSYIQDGHKHWFLLVEFRLVGEQPPDPERFVEKFVEMHKKSVSPTGKFGFHATTFHGKVAQMTDQWGESWSAVFQRHLGHMVTQDEEVNGYWPEFKILCDITLGYVLPRLLEALQSDGRSIKPCLVHGDLWDENTATDMRNGEPFAFDPGSMYAHNEYETGNWRAVRHRLSSARYVGRYQSLFKRSEPSEYYTNVPLAISAMYLTDKHVEEEWGSRNVLYSLRYNLGAAILFPGCAQRKE
ncbi:hypothetical protein Daus18300_001377 [Diaporthe australafricana]|uniref:protein-ribulosamine 3-kinase n=1 Tax=Diaporthe australafricana TaxID=127596 RepID=A0ABR3XXL8_9PEZI